MTPQPFDGNNAVFSIPSGLHGEAVPTPARTSTQYGPGTVTTVWKPSPEEIKRIAAGGLVHICTKGGLAPHFVQA